MKNTDLNKTQLKVRFCVALLIIGLIVISNIAFTPFVVNLAINGNDDSDSTLNQQINNYALNSNLNYLKFLKDTILNDLIAVNKRNFVISLINNDALKITNLRKVNLASLRSPPF
jgi:hypothetical protein